MSRFFVISLQSSQPKSGERYKSIDGLRGLLATVVLASHTLTFCNSSLLVPVSSLCVCAFFVMSGYVLTNSYNNNYLAFLTKRFTRLWPVYAACLGLGYAVAGVAANWSQFFWYPILTPESLPAIDPPIWSLCIEAWAMLFMPLFVWIGRGPALVVFLGPLAITAAGAFETKLLFGLFFVFGSIASRYVFRCRLLEGRLLQGLGRISYTLYLVHYPLLSFAHRNFGEKGVIFALPFVFAVAWLLCRYLDEPSVRLSRALSRRVQRALMRPVASTPFPAG
jgi:peptidoglycan/LPS O-acetylase OafA/YrhL